MRIAVLAIFLVTTTCQPRPHDSGRAQGAEIVSIRDQGLALSDYGLPVLIGGLADTGYPGLGEISGLVHSRQHENLLWAIADETDRLFAIRYRKENGGYRLQLSAVKVKGAKPYDWEDIAIFSSFGDHYLVIADVGANDAKHGKKVRKCKGTEAIRLHIIKEPDPDARSCKVRWTMCIETPYLEEAIVDGKSVDFPHDIESVAIDSVTSRVLLMKKRTRSKPLLVLPFELKDRLVKTAEQDWQEMYLPEPTKRERQWYKRHKKNARQTSRRCQPTGLDISRDGSKVVLLTHRHAYLYQRRHEESWTAALARKPRQVSLPFYFGRKYYPEGSALTSMAQREAVCFDSAGGALFVAGESTEKGLASLIVSMPRARNGR